MLHKLKLTNFEINEISGQVSIEFDWNGAAHNQSWQSIEDFYAQNADLLQASAEAARFLMAYMLLLGETHETLASKVGDELKIEIDHAVMQAITLTPPPPA